MTLPLLIAMDRAATGRRIDADGHMHVAHNNVAKACVSPYFGSEIPNWQGLGLQPDKRYNLLRHPDELAKAVGTFNGKPVLIDHEPTTAEDHKTELVVGTTGTNATFDGRYVDNAISLWESGAIDGVVSRRKFQLSPAYRYVAEMTPGNFEGMQHDGIMRNIECNHVALVFEGRQGPDVVVGDESMKLKSRAAYMVGGALTAMVRPLLAADARVDIAPALEGQTAASMNKDWIATKVVEIVTPHLAADKAITVEDVAATVASIALDAKDDEIADPAPVQTPAPVVPPQPVTPQPSPDPAKPGSQPQPVTQTAMDAAVDKARKDALAESAAIRTAEREVFPHVGEVVAMDSAAAVYKMALDAAKVDLAGIDTTNAATLRAMVKMLPVAQDAAPIDLPVALDAGAANDFKSRFPNATPLVRS